MCIRDRLLGLYENPHIIDYKSFIPSPTPRKLPLVGWAFTVYPKPTMIYQEGVGISERSFGTEPEISLEMFNQLLPEHIFASRLRVMIQRLAGHMTHDERHTGLARILQTGETIYQLDHDLPLGFYLLGAHPDSESLVEDFIVAPEVEFSDIALVMADRLAHVSSRNN